MTESRVVLLTCLTVHPTSHPHAHTSGFFWPIKYDHWIQQDSSSHQADITSLPQSVKKRRVNNNSHQDCDNPPHRLTTPHATPQRREKKKQLTRRRAAKSLQELAWPPAFRSTFRTSTSGRHCRAPRSRSSTLKNHSTIKSGNMAEKAADG